MNYERSFVVESLRELLDVYGVAYPSEVLREYDVEGSGLPSEDIGLFADERALVIMVPWMDPDDRQTATQELLDLGLESCIISNTNRHYRFDLWHHPSFQVTCY